MPVETNEGGPAEVRPSIARGREAFSRGDYVTALDEFNSVVDRHPQYADIHQLMGLCFCLLGQPEAGLQSFEHALRINPNYVEALLNKAITLSELGEFEAANEAFEAARESEYAGDGRFSSAVANRLAEGHAELGDRYLEAGEVEESVRQFSRAVELRPTYPDLRTRLAEALLRSGDLDAAEEQLDRAVEDRPAFVRARAARGLLYLRRGDSEAARTEWLRCQRDAPDDALVRAYLSMLETDASGRES
ncbi:MAG TPA: tetratricopeptide repeat protein [Longimicrobiales bacterium]|nr:tetratricopeptide repeat protein [Longimicrobiales bacterium]